MMRCQPSCLIYYELWHSAVGKLQIDEGVVSKSSGLGAYADNAVIVSRSKNGVIENIIEI